MLESVVIIILETLWTIVFASMNGLKDDQQQLLNWRSHLNHAANIVWK